MKLKFTRKTWYFFLLAAAAMSMLGGFAVLGGMDFSGLELIVFCITGIAVLFLAAQKGAPAKDKRSYTLVFVLLMISKLAAGGWAGDLCSALVWPGLLAIEYGHGRPVHRQRSARCLPRPRSCFHSTASTAQRQKTSRAGPEPESVPSTITFPTRSRLRWPCWRVIRAVWPTPPGGVLSRTVRNPWHRACRK